MDTVLHTAYMIRTINHVHDNAGPSKPFNTNNKRRRLSATTHPLCRVIGVGDADSFEVQVYQKHPEHAHTIGCPTVVVQDTGRIVSRSHEAKDFKITRSHKVWDARKLCPNLQIIEVKKKYGKPDRTELHKFSNQIREAALSFRANQLIWPEAGLEKVDLPIEVTGCDEFILDLTECVNCLIHYDCVRKLDTSRKIFMEGKRSRYNDTGLENRIKYYYSKQHFQHVEEIRLAHGLVLMDEMCRYIFQETGMVLSGGVGSNKVLAKLACGLHKPNAVTALTRRGFYRISHRVNFRNLSGLGGELGESLQMFSGQLNLNQLNLQKMRKIVISKFSLLSRYLGDVERASKARDLLLGLCYDPVKNKLMPKGMNCARGNLDIRTEAEFKAALNTLVQNVLERITEEEEENKRIPIGLKIQYATRRNPRQSTFFVNYDAAVDKSFEENCKGGLQKSLFNESVTSAITNNNYFQSHCDNIIHWMNFQVTDYRKFAEVNLVKVDFKI